MLFTRNTKNEACRYATCHPCHMMHNVPPPSKRSTWPAPCTGPPPVNFVYRIFVVNNNTCSRCEDDVEVRREAARLLFALSLNELNKLDVAGVGGTGGSSGDGGGGGDGGTAEVATDLVALARSDDPSCARNAVGALANLSENDATHERLLGWGAGFLSKLALENAPPDGTGEGLANEESQNDRDSRSMAKAGEENGDASGGAGSSMDVGLVREVTRCLANLAGNYATHEKLLDGGAADALVGSLKRVDAVTARFAALGLANLAGQVGGRAGRPGRRERIGSNKLARCTDAPCTGLQVVCPQDTYP